MLARDVTGTVSVSELRVRTSCCHLSLGIEVSSLRGDTVLCATGEKGGAGDKGILKSFRSELTVMLSRLEN